MTLGNVTLALAAEFDPPTEIGTGKCSLDNDLLFYAIQVTEDRLKECLSYACYGGDPDRKSAIS